MAGWMTIGELAGECRADVYVLREALELLRFFDAGEPTPLAIRHPPATPEVDDGDRAILLWHADAVILAKAVLSGGQFDDASTSCGLFASEDTESEYVQGGLFGVEAEIETVGEGDAGGPAADGAGGTFARREVTGSVGAGPMGRIAEGLDVIVTTDGVCSSNPGSDGWAWIKQAIGGRSCGETAYTINNAMEPTVFARAFERVGPRSDLLMRIGSQYAIKAMTVQAKVWRRKGRRKSDGAPAANRDLVEWLLELCEGKQGQTEVKWIKRHSSDAVNELVDSMAAAQAVRHRRRTSRAVVGAPDIAEGAENRATPRTSISQRRWAPHKEKRLACGGYSLSLSAAVASGIASAKTSDDWVPTSAAHAPTTVGRSPRIHSHLASVTSRSMTASHPPISRRLSGADRSDVASPTIRSIALGGGLITSPSKGV